MCSEYNCCNCVCVKSTSDNTTITTTKKFHNSVRFMSLFNVRYLIT